MKDRDWPVIITLVVVALVAGLPLLIITGAQAWARALAVLAQVWR